MRIILRALCLLAAPLLAVAGGAPGVKAQFIGGTLAGVPARSAAHLDLSSPDVLVLVCNGAELRIDYHKINTLEYGQNVSRRYAAAILVSPVLLLSKSRTHFVTVGYVDADGRQQALVFRVEKGDIRMVLASLEARTGRRVEFLDEEARKSGKG
jgi:hypothetical protein